MIRKTRGYKVPNFSKNMPNWEPYSTCAHALVPYNLSNRVKQMRQSATGTYWDGNYVDASNLDPLNDQLRLPPIAVPDPPWVDQPRPDVVWENQWLGPPVNTD